MPRRSTARRAACRPARRALPLTLTVLSVLCACGGEEGPRHHGLEVGEIESRPEGEAVRCAFAQRPGDAWVGLLQARFDHRVEEGPPDALEEKQHYRIDAEIEVRQERESEQRSSVRFRFTRADSPDVDERMLEGRATGGFAHDESGRPQPHSLTLEGPLTDQAGIYLRSFMLAGFGGAPPWLPDGEIRSGETIDLSRLGTPAAMEALQANQKRPGETWPEPTLRGHVRVVALRESDGIPVADLEIDALIEMNGTVERSGGRRTEVRLGEHVTGTAVVSLETGLPLTFDVQRIRKVNQDNGGIRTRERMEARVTGTVDATRNP